MGRRYRHVGDINKNFGTDYQRSRALYDMVLIAFAGQHPVEVPDPPGDRSDADPYIGNRILRLGIACFRELSSVPCGGSGKLGVGRWFQYLVAEGLFFLRSLSPCDIAV